MSVDRKPTSITPVNINDRNSGPLFNLEANTPRSLQLDGIRETSRVAVETIQGNLLAEIVTPLALRRLRASMKAGDSSKDDQR